MFEDGADNEEAMPPSPLSARLAAVHLEPGAPSPSGLTPTAANAQWGL